MMKFGLAIRYSIFKRKEIMNKEQGIMNDEGE